MRAGQVPPLLEFEPEACVSGCNDTLVEAVWLQVNLFMYSIKRCRSLVGTACAFIRTTTPAEAATASPAIVVLQLRLLVAVAQTQTRQARSNRHRTDLSTLRQLRLLSAATFRDNLMTTAADTTISAVHQLADPGSVELAMTATIRATRSRRSSASAAAALLALRRIRTPLAQRRPRSGLRLRLVEPTTSSQRQRRASIPAARHGTSMIQKKAARKQSRHNVRMFCFACSFAGWSTR